jgi:hypothetical protein
MSRPPTQKQIYEAIHWLAAKGLIYDTGERRKGQILWSVTPGKEAERALLERTAALEPKRKAQSDE